MFAWTYKDLKGIPPKLVQHIIELNTSIPPAHQARYTLNPNYVAIVKHDIDKVLATRFIQPVEEATWLSPIVVLPKMNGKLEEQINIHKVLRSLGSNIWTQQF